MNQSSSSEDAGDSLEEEVALLRNRLLELSSRAENISIYRPLHCYREMSSLARKMRFLEPAFTQAITKYEARFHSSPKVLIMPSTGPSLMLGKTLSGMMSLEWAWNELIALRDRKSAYSLAVFSLYVALVSLTVSVVSIVIPFVHL